MTSEGGAAGVSMRNVAMVFLNYALYPHLNVAKNIAFGLHIRKTPCAEIDAQTKDVGGISQNR